MPQRFARKQKIRVERLLMNSQKNPALVFVALLATTAPALATNGYFSHGYGIKTKALAGAGIALPQDSLAIATNPAGLTQIATRFDVGVDWFKPKRGASIVDNNFGPDQNFDGNDTESFLIPELGYNHKLNENLAAGIAVYGNGGMNTDYQRNPYARFGASGDAGVDLSQVFFSPAWGSHYTQTHSSISRSTIRRSITVISNPLATALIHCSRPRLAMTMVPALAGATAR